MNSVSFKIVKRDERKFYTFLRRQDTDDEVFKYEQCTFGDNLPLYYVEYKPKGKFGVTRAEAAHKRAEEFINEL